jgi:DNA polymerase/3'-5' exonuclease PolX
MDTKAKLIAGFKRYREETTKEKSSGWQFKVRAYNKIMKLIREHDGEITSSESFRGIKGVGPKMLEKMEKILADDSEVDSETQAMNQDIKKTDDLLRITGIGPVRAKDLVSKGYTLERILSEYAAGKLDESLFTHHILIGIKYFHDIEKRIPREEIEMMKEYMSSVLVKNVDTKLRIQVCGSFRRGKKESGDMDVLVYSNKRTDGATNEYMFERVIEQFTLDNFIVDSLTPNVNKTKFMGVCRYMEGYPCRRIDIRFVDKERLAFAMLYFTGSGDFNVKMRSFALKKGFTINEYSIKNKKTNEEVSGINTERDIFKFLGLDYVPPEKRLPEYTFS